MLTAGAERTFKPVIDGMISSIRGWLSLFALALGVLHLMPQWMSGTAMVLASLLLALSGLTRYMADPGTPLEQEAAPVRPTLPAQDLQSPESWAVAFFLAGSALSGSMTLAAAFAGLTLLTASGLSLWAMAGWSGCRYLTSGWHRRTFSTGASAS